MEDALYVYRDEVEEFLHSGWFEILTAALPGNVPIEVVRDYIRTPPAKGYYAQPDLAPDGIQNLAAHILVQARRDYHTVIKSRAEEPGEVAA